MMAHLSGIQIGKQARALAAALALGAAVLSLATGPTAYAARVSSTDAGDTDIGSEPGVGTATRSNLNNYPKCTITSPDGHIDFYIPGDTVVRDGKTLWCGADGGWVVVDRGTDSAGTYTGGGVYTRAP
jgi:hypothetical protein